MTSIKHCWLHLKKHSYGEWVHHPEKDYIVFWHQTPWIATCKDCGALRCELRLKEHLKTLKSQLDEVSKLREEVAKLRATKDREIWWAERYFNKEKEING